MKKSKLLILFCTLLIANSISMLGNASIFDEKIDINDFLKNDFIINYDFGGRGENTGSEPGYYDLSEFMIGTVAVGVIFLESDGSIDPSTEDWTQTEINNAQTAINYALSHWTSWFSSWYQGTYHNIMFYKETHLVNISYEPITHPSAMTDNTYEKLWVCEAMAELGYNSGDWIKRTRDYANYIRDNMETIPGYYGTDWAFVIFMIDNSNDGDTYFSDGYHAYAYLGGPFCVVPHVVPWPPGGPQLKEVLAHEIGHIFYATDEYNGVTDYSGYLNEPDTENSNCIMDSLALCTSDGTKKQIGWKDTDSDWIVDILDTNPETTLNPYTPDPTSNPVLTYTGSSNVVPATNQNPNGPGNDVTTNTIAGVEYRVDGGSWQYANPVDGSFDDPVEQYTFTVTLSVGTHTIETRAMNSVNNYDLTPAVDTVTVTPNTAPNKPTKPSGPNSGKTDITYTYSSSAIDSDGDQVRYGWDWDGDSVVDEWTSYANSGQTVSASHAWSNRGTYNVKVIAEDINSAQSQWSEPLSVTIPRNRLLIQNLIIKILERFPNAFPIFRQLTGL